MRHKWSVVGLYETRGIEKVFTFPLWYLFGRFQWFQSLWSYLPDRCEIPGCSRQGVRGNENVIQGKIVCDYCHAEMDSEWSDWI